MPMSTPEATASSNLPPMPVGAKLTPASTSMAPISAVITVALALLPGRFRRIVAAVIGP